MRHTIVGIPDILNRSKRVTRKVILTKDRKLPKNNEIPKSSYSLCIL